MGVVDFDPEKWSRANFAEDAGEVAKAAKVAKVSPNPQQHSQLSQLSQADALPEAVRAGLDILREMKPPKWCDPLAWRLSVTAALRLVSGGWASQAIALGWTPLDLFGAVADPDGDSAADGLAVKLNGRRVLAICDSFATVEDEGGGRSYLYRGETSSARLLWDLGRGR